MRMRMRVRVRTRQGSLRRGHLRAAAERDPLLTPATASASVAALLEAVAQPENAPLERHLARRGKPVTRVPRNRQR
jgi:hypothetical protein